MSSTSIGDKQYRTSLILDKALLSEIKKGPKYIIIFLFSLGRTTSFYFVLTVRVINLLQLTLLIHSFQNSLQSMEVSERGHLGRFVTRRAVVENRTDTDSVTPLMPNMGVITAWGSLMRRERVILRNVQVCIENKQDKYT